MVSDVQKRFVDPSFPPELRLQVLKAGVPYSSTRELRRYWSMEQFEVLKTEAHDELLFPPWDDLYERDPSRYIYEDPVVRSTAEQAFLETVGSTAEQAFLETVILKIGINETLPFLRLEDRMPGLNTIPDAIKSRIHYLDLSTTVNGTWDRPYDKLPLHVAWSRRATASMDMLKVHFPNLKACVLNLELAFCMFGPPRQPFGSEALQWTTGTEADFSSFQMRFDPNTDCFETSLPVEVSNLFDAFIAKGPGKS